MAKAEKQEPVTLWLRRRLAAAMPVSQEALRRADAARVTAEMAAKSGAVKTRRVWF